MTLPTPKPHSLPRSAHARRRRLAPVCGVLAACSAAAVTSSLPAAAQEPSPPDAAPAPPQGLPPAPPWPPVLPGEQTTPPDVPHRDAPRATVSPVTPGRNLDAPVGPDGKPIVIRPGQPTRVPPGAAPGPAPGERPNTLYIDSADEFVRPVENPNLAILQGEVALRYNGYRVTADRATFDFDTRIATFESRVEMNTGSQVVYADFVRIDLRTQDFLSRNARTVVPAELAGNSLLEPLFLSAETIERRGRDIVATAGMLTTCDFPFPHYRVGFGKATIIPNKRIIVRGATIYQYDRRTVSLSRFEIPIRDEIRYGYLPQFGRTQEEGYFVKNALGYTLGDDFPGIFRLDLMQKKGIGIGTDQAYRLGEVAAGTLALYGLQDQGRNVTNLSGRLNHLQRFGEVDVSVNSDFQQNSYYAAQQNSKTQNSTITAIRNIGPSNSTVTLNLGNSTYSGTSSRNTSYTITQVQRLTRDFSVTARLNGTSQNSESFGTDGALLSSTARREQVGDIRATGRLGLFDVDFNANKILASRLVTSSGGASSVFSGTERLPELILSTDSTRLGGFLSAVPTRLLLGLGRFVENPGAITTSRALLQADVNPRPFPLTPGGALSFTFSGGFRQYLYDSGDAAQYVLNTNSQLTQRIGRDSSLNLTYGYLRPYGGTPVYLREDAQGNPQRFDFRLDSFGSNNNLGANLTINRPRLRFSALTGYDIQRAQADLPAGTSKNPWQNLALQLALRPMAILQSRFTATYNLNTPKPRLIDFTNRTRIRAGNGFSLDTSLRYDTNRREITPITFVLETPLPKDFSLLFLGQLTTTVTFVGEERHVRRKLDYSQFALTKSLHDYEITFGYIDQPFGGYRAERGFTFSIRLKAFPAGYQNTTGQYGTALGTGLGEVF